MVSPETERGIAATALFTIAGLAFLAIFGLAGDLGRGIDAGLSALLGATRVIFPALLVVAAGSILTPRFRLGPAGAIGLLLLLISMNALLDLVRTGSGGYVGLVVATPVVAVGGPYAASVIFGGLFVASIMLAFNTSLHRFAALLAPLFRRTPKTVVPTATPESRREWQERAIEVSVERASPKDVKEAVGLKLTRAPRRRVEVPLDLLSTRSTKPSAGDIDAASDRIQKTLAQFGVDVEMGEIAVGPTVTQYTLKPADGVKLSKITGLSNDLALALAAHPIRIEAPIPGKSLVGIEVPNVAVSVVPLREILESGEFTRRRGELNAALGKDVAGAPWFFPIESAPHVLVAGATGSGKTVCLNALIVSLLYQYSPDELKFLMVDPKRVELPNYNGIPHLVAPVITDVPKTVNALKWCIGEMERRFDLLAKVGKRDISAYNKNGGEKMPYLVVVVDELADLMATAASEVESSIIRLAQMSRATGIHLVLATQRPSVDVITGLIKANITTRLAFSVASATDSRTILDTSGAEKLLGRGDMLFINSQLSKPKRLQGAFVSDEEIGRVVEYIKKEAGEPEYVDGVTDRQTSIPTGASGGSNASDDDDPLLDEAKDTVLRAGKASASLLQRRLSVGYARAARLLDLLEAQGIIGPGEGAKPRAILVARPAEFENMESENDGGEEEQDT